MLASDVADQLVTKVKHEDCYATAIDESIEITDVAQTLIFIKYVSGQKLTKGLLVLSPQKQNQRLQNTLCASPEPQRP